MQTPEQSLPSDKKIDKQKLIREITTEDQIKTAEKFAKPIESEELENLGAEIEEELQVEEQAKKPPEYQVKNFHSLLLWREWEKVKTSGLEEAKAPIREKLILKLNELEEKIGNDTKLQEAINIIRKEIGAPSGHA